MQVTKTMKITLVAAAVLAAGVVYLWRGLAPRPPEGPDMTAAREALNRKDYDAIVGQVQTKPVSEAGAYVRALGKLGLPAQPALNRLLDRRNEPRLEVRAKAATALNATLPADQPKDAFGESVKALVESLRRDPAHEVRVSAATTLGLSRSYETMDDLIDAMNDEQIEVRRAALAAVNKILCLKLDYNVEDEKPQRDAFLKILKNQWHDEKYQSKVVGYYRTGRFKTVYRKYAR
ncbi:MAG: HEAT repeat domain-containing protein [Planctomycetaceae bacterium]|nr:HEAT repeat domain-containing protein [Planctomycetaceae bacterium]